MSRHLRISTIVYYNKTHIKAKEEIWVTKEADTKGEYGCKPQTHPTKKPKPRNWDSGLILCRTKWTISGNTSKFSLQKIIKTIYKFGPEAVEDTEGISIHFGLGDHKQVAATGCLWYLENGQQRIRAQVDVWAWVMTKCQIFIWTLGAPKAACVDICDSCHYKVPCQSGWSAQLCGAMVTSGFGCCCIPCLGSWSCQSQGLYWCPWPILLSGAMLMPRVWATICDHVGIHPGQTTSSDQCCQTGP